MTKIRLANKNISKSILTEKKKEGFLIVEVLLALFIITAGLVVVLALFSKTAVNANQDRDSVIGTLLAQEGVEMVRNIRDNNWANNKGAFDTGTFPTVTRINCKVAVGANSTFSDSVCSPTPFNLYLNSNNFYTYVSAGNTPTKFQRRFFIYYDNSTAIGNGGPNVSSPPVTSATITSVVTWDGGTFPNFNGFPPDFSSCTAGAKCAYTQIVLTTWGG